MGEIPIPTVGATVPVAMIRNAISCFRALAPKAEALEADQKVKYYEEIEDLRMKQQRVQTKLDDIRSASDSAWEEIKSGTELAWKELLVSVDRAMDRFR